MFQFLIERITRATEMGQLSIQVNAIDNLLKDHTVTLIQLQSWTKVNVTATKNGIGLVATSNCKLFLETIWPG